MVGHFLLLENIKFNSEYRADLLGELAMGVGEVPGSVVFLEAQAMDSLLTEGTFPF